MEMKTVTILVIVTVVQGCLSTKSSKSCVSQAHIGADLAVVQFGEDTAHHGLERMTVIVFTEIRSTLSRCTKQSRTKTKDEDIRTEIAPNETITALEVGIIPTLEALRTINPAVDFDTGRVQAYLHLERIARNYFHAIELSQGKNTTEILNKIQALDDDTRDAGRVLIAQLSNLIDGAGIAADANDKINCIREKAGREILSALHSVIDGIKLLVHGPCSGENAGSDKCLSTIQATQDKVSGLFKSEVTLKYSAIRNVLIEQLLTKIGIVPGLFAVQAAQAAPMS